MRSNRMHLALKPPEVHSSTGFALEEATTAHFSADLLAVGGRDTQYNDMFLSVRVANKQTNANITSCSFVRGECECLFVCARTVNFCLFTCICVCVYSLSSISKLIMDL